MKNKVYITFTLLFPCASYFENSEDSLLNREKIDHHFITIDEMFSSSKILTINIKYTREWYALRDKI